VTLIETLEAGALAEHLRQSRWTYPLVSAGHIAGIGMLIGAVVPMALASLRDRRAARPVIRLLRPFAVAGFLLAATFGGLLFVAQAGDYVANRWFLAKMALITLALGNAAWHLRSDGLTPVAALASLGLWGAALVSGRMIGFS
jgi:hypothetical protein